MHLIARGNGSQILFVDRSDYEYYFSFQINIIPRITGSMSAQQIPYVFDKGFEKPSHLSYKFFISCLYRIILSRRSE